MLWHTWEAMNLKSTASKLGVENPETASCPCYPWIHDLTNTAAPFFSNFLWLQWVWGRVSFSSWLFFPDITTSWPFNSFNVSTTCFRPSLLSASSVASLSTLCFSAQYGFWFLNELQVHLKNRSMVWCTRPCFGFSLLLMNFVQNNFNFSAICFSTHYKDPKKRSMRCSQNYVFWFQFAVHEFCPICFSAH